MSSSSSQGLPLALHPRGAPRASTPLNLTPPDLDQFIRKGEFIRKSSKKAIQARSKDANDNFVTPYKSSSEDTEKSDKMARGGSGSVAKQPFLEVLERCGQLEMENQGLQAKR